MSSPSIPQFKPPNGGYPPNYMWEPYGDVQNVSIKGDQQSYALSDADFQSRYPSLWQAKQDISNYSQHQLGAANNQFNQEYGNIYNQGSALASRMASGNPYQSSIDNMNYASGQELGEGLAQNQAAAQEQGAGSALSQEGQGIIGSSQPYFQEGNQSINAGAQDIAQGASYINGSQPLNPLIQQEMMKSGLSGAAGALGGAYNLGTGTTGQASVARNLGVDLTSYIAQQQQQGEAMQQTGAGLQGAGAGVAGVGTNLIGQGTNVINAGTGEYQAGNQQAMVASQMLNSGANLGTNAQNMGEQYNLDTSNLLSQYANMGNSLGQGALSSMGLASSINQPRTFGIGGQGEAQVLLSDYAGANNYNQGVFADQMQIAGYNQQTAAQNAQLSAQSTNGLIGTGSTVAIAGAAIAAFSCWVARECYGASSAEWLKARFWMQNLAPKWIRLLYMKHGRDIANYISFNPLAKCIAKLAFEVLTSRVQYAGNILF